MLITRELAEMKLRAPRHSEREPEFVASAVAPRLLRFINTLGVRGLHLGGEGAGPVSAVRYFGRLLKPDLTVLSYDAKLFAVEVKVLHAGGISSSACKAFGQASLYRASGYRHSVMFLIDLNRAVSIEDAIAARALLANANTALIVRQRLGNMLMVDEPLSEALRRDEQLSRGDALVSLTADISRNVDTAHT